MAVVGLVSGLLLAFKVDANTVENVSGIRRCTEGEIRLLTGCGTLTVSGEGLLVKELGESRALITGRLIRWGYGE